MHRIAPAAAGIEHDRQFAGRAHVNGDLRHLRQRKIGLGDAFDPAERAAGEVDRLKAGLLRHARHDRVEHHGRDNEIVAFDEVFKLLHARFLPRSTCIAPSPPLYSAPCRLRLPRLKSSLRFRKTNSGKDHMRPSRRQPDELRAVSLERGVVKYAEGSCFVKFGDTHVLVTATLEDRLPPWLKGQARGWITAEYGMLPRATLERTRREAASGKQSGRTVEIQRLIGRSLRAVLNLEALGERQITIDCDVVQADGGTRTAAITGAWVALYDCLGWMKSRDMLKADPLRDHVAAISCGICNATPVLDLDYAEDSEADTDANFIITGGGRIVEVQATAEKIPFSEEQFLNLLALAKKGVMKLVDLQKLAVM